VVQFEFPQASRRRKTWVTKKKASPEAEEESYQKQAAPRGFEPGCGADRERSDKERLVCRHSHPHQFLLCEIISEVEHHLNGDAIIVVIVIAIHIVLKLSAIAKNLLTPLLERDFHVVAASSSDIRPERYLSRTLTDTSDVLRTDAAALQVRNVFLAHCIRKLFSAPSDHCGALGLPSASFHRPDCHFVRCCGPRLTVCSVFRHNFLQLFPVSHGCHLAT